VDITCMVKHSAFGILSLFLRHWPKIALRHISSKHHSNANFKIADRGIIPVDYCSYTIAEMAD
jgi:hypothetical protein